MAKGPRGFFAFLPGIALFPAALAAQVSLMSPSQPASPAPGITMPTPTSGGAGLYRFLEYLSIDSRLQRRQMDLAGGGQELSRQLEALVEIRRLMDSFDRTYGRGALDAGSTSRKAGTLLRFLGYGDLSARTIKAGGGDREKARRILLSRAGVDLDELVQRLRAGQDVDLSLPYFQAKLPQAQVDWFREALRDPQLTSDRLLVRFLNDARAGMLYMVLARMDEPTVHALRTQVGLLVVYQDERLLWGLFNFGEALHVRTDGDPTSIVLPGMPSEPNAPIGSTRLCARVWADLLGCPVEDMARVVPTIFRDGRTAYFYSVLAKQPRQKQVALLGLALREPQALQCARRLYDAVRLPFADAYDDRRIGWRRLWDFQDLIMHAQIDSSTGQLVMPATPIAWHIALKSTDPLADEPDVEDLRRKVAELTRDPKWAHAGPMESLLEIAESLEDARSDVLVAQRRSPAEKFATIQAVFADQREVLGNISVPALYRNFDRHGDAYRLLQGIPLGGGPLGGGPLGEGERRVVQFLLQLHRIDHLGNRDLRNATIELFECCLRMLQIAALDHSLSAGDLTALFDQLMSVEPEQDAGLGWTVSEWIDRFVRSLGASASGDAHSILAGALGGAGRPGAERPGAARPVDVPILRQGEGTFYYIFDRTRIASRATASFLAQQHVSTIDTVQALWKGLRGASESGDSFAAGGLSVAARADAIERHLREARAAVDLLRLPESETLRALSRQNEIPDGPLGVRDFRKWHATECNAQIRRVLASMVRLAGSLQKMEEDWAEGRDRVARVTGRGDEAAAGAELRRVSERLRTQANEALPALNNFLATTLVGYLYARDLDPRYPTKSGLVIGHCFERPDREGIDQDNPWAEGRIVDLSWSSGRCVQKGAIVGGVDQIPFAMRGYRLGRMLDMDAAASQANAQLDAQFSAVQSLPGAGCLTDEGMRFVQGCFDLGVSAVSSTDRPTRDLADGVLPEIVGRRRFALLQASAGPSGVTERDLTPSELYFIGLRVLDEAGRGWRPGTPSPQLPTLIQQRQDSRIREAARQLIGVPMRRTNGSIGLVEDIVAPYEEFEADMSGMRIVERINPRVMLCVTLARMDLPAQLMPAIQPALYDRILDGTRQAHINDWLSVEETARRVTTEATIREILEGLTRGNEPILTMD
ncbi:MAG: hypothetical protein HYX75_13850 [Acidobacteria bacterium]|nr:hypothetical protein [Acidobacteriota bacterium]